MISMPQKILAVVVSVFDYCQPYWCRSAWTDKQSTLDWHFEEAKKDLE